MTAIVTNRQTGDSIPASDHNSLALALKAQGIANDDAGKLILAASLDVPFAIVSSIGSVQAKAVTPGSTYNVPSGKLFYGRTITGLGSSSITPNGAGAFTFTATASALHAPPIGICLGAGDAITLHASASLVGILGDLPSAPSAPTRIIQEVNNASTYTVPASKALLLTHAYPSTSTSAVTLTIDGVSAFQSIAIFGVANRYPAWVPLYLAAGQTLAVATAVNYTISGLLYTV